MVRPPGAAAEPESHAGRPHTIRVTRPGPSNPFGCGGQKNKIENGEASCKTDFTFMALSWETLLKPKLRAPDQPKQKIELTYGEAKGNLAVYAGAFRDMKFLETMAEAIGERYAWPQPFVMEMVECGEVGANWRSRKLKICYEMAQEFAELYRLPFTTGWLTLVACEGPQ